MAKKITKKTGVREMADLLYVPALAYKNTWREIEKKKGYMDDAEIASIHGPGVFIYCQLDYLDVRYEFGKTVEGKPFLEFLKKVVSIGGDPHIYNHESGRICVSVNFIDQALFD